MFPSIGRGVDRCIVFFANGSAINVEEMALSRRRAVNAIRVYDGTFNAPCARHRYPLIYNKRPTIKSRIGRAHTVGVVGGLTLSLLRYSAYMSTKKKKIKETRRDTL